MFVLKKVMNEDHKQKKTEEGSSRNQSCGGDALNSTKAFLYGVKKMKWISIEFVGQWSLSPNSILTLF